MRAKAAPGVSSRSIETLASARGQKRCTAGGPGAGVGIVRARARTTIRQARAKTDRLDARALARLLAAGSLDHVWVPDEQTWMLRRRLSRRAQLVRERTPSKNEIHAIVIRRLIGRPPATDCSASRAASG
jgi:hypothetical protein